MNFTKSHLNIFISFLLYSSYFTFAETASVDEFSMSPSSSVNTIEPVKKKGFLFNWFKKKTPPQQEIKPEEVILKSEESDVLIGSKHKPSRLGPLELELVPNKSTRDELPYHYRFKTPALIKSDKEGSTLKPLEYLLKPGDKIEISVWGEDMTKELMVRPDGLISYILIDEIMVTGKTFKELKLEIQEKLSKYIIDPKVSIIGKSFEGNFVSILGAVKDPGRKVVSNSDKIIDVLSKAGGLKFVELGSSGKEGEIANLKNAYLSREGKLVDIDFSKLIYEGDMTQNAPVQIGDFIYIPSSNDVPIYITGEFMRPTSLPFKGRPTLLEAISEGGGLNNDASKQNIKVVRGGLLNPSIINFNYYDIVNGKIKNPYLEPGDIVYVPPTTLTNIERISTQIIPFLDSIIRTGQSKDTLQNW